MIKIWRKIYAKHDSVKAYSLLSPALILVILAMVVPMSLMLSFSMFTQVNMMEIDYTCLLYTSPSPRDVEESRMPSSA